MTRASVKRGAQGYHVSTLGNGRVAATTVRAPRSKRGPSEAPAAPGPWAFVVDGPPVGKGRPRASRAGARVIMRTPDETRRYEAWVAMSARPWMPREVIDGPLEVIAEFVYPRPKRLSGAVHVPAPVKPDIDNAIKALLDGLKDHFRDEQVVTMRVTKRYATKIEQPHTTVQVSRVEIYLREGIYAEARLRAHAPLWLRANTKERV